MKKKFLLFVFAGIFLFYGNVYSNVYSNVDAVDAYNREAAAALDKCETAATEAEQATMGMDPMAMMMIGQVSGSVSSVAAAKGTAAKKLYQLDGGVKGTLAAIGTGKYMKCKAAISTCETSCATAEGADPNPAKKAALARCTALKSTCSMNGLQAIVSGTQALTAFIGANALGGDGEGGGDDDTKAPPPAPPPLPDVPKIQQPKPMQPPGPPSNGSDELITPPPGGDTEPDGPGKAGKQPETKWEPQNEGPGSGLPPTFAGPSSSTGSGSSNTAGAGITTSADGSQGLAPDISDEVWGDDEENGEGEDEASKRRYASSGAFAGSGYGGQGAKFRGSHFGGSGGKGGRGKKGSLKKKGQAKKSGRDIFGKSSQKDSIFKKMSRLIHSYCQTGGEKC